MVARRSHDISFMNAAKLVGITSKCMAPGEVWRGNVMVWKSCSQLLEFEVGDACFVTRPGRSIMTGGH
jgi:hypothetical protein